MKDLNPYADQYYPTKYTTKPEMEARTQKGECAYLNVDGAAQPEEERAR